MIKAIEIIINSGVNIEKNYLISYTNKACYIDDKKYDLTDEYLDNLKNTILYWKKEYGTKNIIDVEEFTINVYSDKGTDTYHGKGIYPNNYELLKEMLGDFNG